jgi:phosphate:Na+ symporter
MLSILTTLGGVALILFGVRFLRKGLDRLFGPKLGHWMQRLANHRLRAFLAGIGVAMLAPSSTSMSILAVQSVQAGHLTGRQMFAVMLGADIGLTVMVLLIAMRLEQYAPLLILVGVFFFQYTKDAQLRGVGQVIISIGFIFMAIGMIKLAAGAIEPGGDFVDLLDIAQRYPLLLTAIGAVLALVMQSSTAAIALVIGLGAAAIVKLPLALAVVLGANIGIAINTVIVGWPQRESRRLGLSNLIAKATVAVIILAAMPVALRLLEMVPGGLDKQTAAAHTGFNVVVALLFLPLIAPVTALCQWLVPDRPAGEQEVFGPRYVSGEPVGGLALATGQSLREILRVSEIVRSMLADLWRALISRDIELAQKVQQRDDQVDLLDTQIKRFLTRLSMLEGDQDERGEIMSQLRYLTELETIGDVIDKNLAELVIKRAKLQVDFSSDGWKELDDFYHKVAENVLIAETAFTTRDQILAQRLLRHKDRLGELERELRDRHFGRLRSGLQQTHESSAIHLDLLTHLKRINSCVTHVAYAIVQTEGGARR